ncbi:Uncharacterised protein [Haemophilus parahaemolyticus]|uniref:Lipoprotein n=1 Tax=Haemophilus parahaemolyticus TaxID=735 RepID=A0A377HYZ2_HAEPH|nr:hypothetical protein [Haemophilus parahaemolyticus]STO63422.1 Uncharacterised protein [Haemophilus parahaemolyticus]
MKISKLIILASICTTLAGCANMQMPKKPVDRWFKDGVSRDMANSKYAKCTYDVGMNKVEVTEKYTLINSCMLADGYRYGVPQKELQEWEDKVESLRKQGYMLY